MSGWLAQRSLLAACRALVAIVENGLGLVCTRAAARGDAKGFAQLVQVVATGRSSTANLLVGYGFADADIHDFNTLSPNCD